MESNNQNVINLSDFRALQEIQAVTIPKGWAVPKVKIVGDVEARVISVEGEPWFFLEDILPPLMRRRIASGVNEWSGEEAGDSKGMEHCEKDEAMAAFFEEAGQDAPPHIIVAESVLYRLLLMSCEPEAREFQTWVIREALPNIRQAEGRQIKDMFDAPLPVAVVEVVDLPYERTLREQRRQIEELAASVGGAHGGDGQGPRTYAEALLAHVKLIAAHYQTLQENQQLRAELAELRGQAEG